MTVKSDLEIWRNERGIVKPSNSFIDFIDEELTEYVEAETEHDKIDAIADIMVFCLNELALEGYDSDHVMSEVVKEIMSREGSIDPTTGKWVKDRTSYKAKYTKK